MTEHVGSDAPVAPYSFQTKKVGQTKVDSIPKDGPRSHSDSKKSIAQEPDSVNSKFSISAENSSDNIYSLGEAENGDVKGNEAEAEPTDRELLAMALEGAVQSEEEYTIVKEYREQASMLDLVEEKKKSYAKEASSLERQIKALRERMNEEGELDTTKSFEMLLMKEEF